MNDINSHLVHLLTNVNPFISPDSPFKYECFKLKKYYCKVIAQQMIDFVVENNCKRLQELTNSNERICC